MAENKEMNLRKYSISNFVKYFDLTNERMDFLGEVLTMYNADNVSVSEFKERFFLDNQDYFGILTFILDTTNLAKLNKKNKTLSLS